MEDFSRDSHEPDGTDLVPLWNFLVGVQPVTYQCNGPSLVDLR